MGQKLRLIILSVFLTLLFAEIWLGFPINLESGGDNDPEFSPSKLTNNDADKRMEGVHFVESRLGNRDWEMFAESAEGSQVSGEWTLHNVRVLFYGDEGAEFTVTGHEGSVDSQTRNMKISGDVVVTTKSKLHLQTKAVQYISDKRMIESLSAVRMSADSEETGTPLVVDGDHFSAFVDNKRIHIDGNVRAHKTLADGKHVQLHSDSAEGSGRDRSVKFVGHVETMVDTLKMQSSETSVQYDKSSSLLQSMLIGGGVRLSDVNKYATANTIEFHPAENEFVLSGNPRVVQNNDEITGDKIIFIDGGRKVRVEKMKARMERNSD